MTKLVTLMMMASLASLASLAAMAEVYRSVDAEGEVTYSDKPGPNAKKVKLPEVMIYSPPPIPQRDEQSEPPKEPPPYLNMSIIEPQSDATIWDNQGIIPLVLALEPELRVTLGHRIQLMIDGSPHGQPRATTRIHIADLDRGTHKIGAQVVDRKGKTLIATSPVTVHLHRQSIFFPNRREGQPSPGPAPGPAPGPIVTP